MKHIYITLIIIFSSFVLNAQEVFFLHAVKVHEDRVESFEKIQKNYARELAQDAKNEGILKDWVLFKPVQFMGESTEQEYNYVWVHIFKDVKQMVNRTTWWDKSKEKFGIEPSILFREDLEKSGYLFSFSSLLTSFWVTFVEFFNVFGITFSSMEFSVFFH